jgi:hypothetical protein
MRSAIEPTQYLPFVNKKRAADKRPPVTGDTIVECCMCPTKFRIKDGAAFEARYGEEPIIGLFCTAACFLRAVPLECCANG